ncbi:MAG: class I SAM-dependent methyltransferase [Planctomycetota bacterium]
MISTTFKDKWEKNARLVFKETLSEKSEIFQWILNRNGFKTPSAFRAYLRGRRRILDAGCGNGRVTALLRKYSDPRKAEVVGIDIASAHVARRNLANVPNVSIRKKDILAGLSDLGRFDFIYCQEVLHHTPNPRKAFLNLTERLEKGGEIAIYVYKKKAPMREFVDDYVRSRISKLPYDKAMVICDQITRLGKTLHEMKTRMKVPSVEILEIEGGKYDLQRFVYYFFMKCFWNPSLSFHANSVINYDWYHPHYCSRYRRDDVREWFRAAHLRVVHECVDHYGITMRGRAR